MRTPVARRTSTAAQAQKAWSSSQRQIAAFAGGRVVGPDLVGRGAGSDGADEGLPGGGEGLAGRGVRGRLSSSASAVLRRCVDGADQDRQHGQPFAGAGVHAGLALSLGLAPVDLLRADRAGRDPRGPAGRVLDGPLGQVEVEGPHRGQALRGS